MVKTDNSGWFVLVLVLLAIVYWGFTGGFTNTIIDTTLIQQLEGEGLGTCTLACNPKNIDSGEQVTCEVQDGINADCIVGYTQDGGPWTYLASIKTDSNGQYSATQPIAEPGTYTFRLICDACISNLQLVTVESTAPADPDPEDTSFCTDSDGGKFEGLPGHVTTILGSMYDTCQGDTAVLEFYCEGTSQKSETIACPNGCFATRSGGYCIEDADPVNPHEGIFCEATYPQPNGYEDCSVRTGCDQSACEFVLGGIAGIDRCQCVEEVGPFPPETVEISHWFSGGSDELPLTVTSVVLVSQGSTTYQSNVDYSASSNYIDWSLHGEEPFSGSTYVVHYYK